jgi:RNA processing factor Prp31
MHLKPLRKFDRKKTKSDTARVATIENIFLTYEISPAKYHGGKLNGVDYREVMYKAKDLFHDIKSLLLSISHPNRYSNKMIIQCCNIFQDILVTLDLICSKIFEMTRRVFPDISQCATSPSG